jgi:hypothetical protein
MTTFDDHVRALSGLGFSERQTRFITLVALHSGFCLRRQYAAFAGLRYGAGVRDFLDRLVTRRLARRYDFRPDRGHVYHLHNSSIYGAIEQDDNRNRRRTSPALIARKLMLLDFILQHQDTEWYATEADKVDLFTGRFGVTRPNLPRRLYRSQKPGTAPTERYFIHKLPIGLPRDSNVPSFVFLVTDTRGHAFRQFVQDHRPLLNRLSTWRIAAVAPKHVPGLTACQNAFKQLASRPAGVRDITPELETHFAVREQMDRDDWKNVSVVKINEFRETRSRFPKEQLDSLYDEWKRSGPSVLRTPLAAHLLGLPIESRGALVTHQLPIRYDRFGSFAGIV